jgi:hypothetical protein
VVANRLQPPAADRLRTQLWQAVGAEVPALTDTTPAAGVPRRKVA